MYVKYSVILILEHYLLHSVVKLYNEATLQLNKAALAINHFRVGRRLDGRNCTITLNEFCRCLWANKRRRCAWGECVLLGRTRLCAVD